MKTTTRVAVATVLALVLLAAGFAGGFATSKVVSYGSIPSVSLPGVGETSTADVGSNVDKVNQLLQRDALNPPSEASATAGAIQGLISSGGDKYAMYFDAKHYQYFNEENMGSFGGIGVALGEKDGAAYVVDVYKGTPAAKAGIKQNDVIRGIDGVTRQKWAVEEVVKRVRGQKGTRVTVTVYRPSTKKEITFKLVRDEIKYPNVESKLYGKVGYIRLAQFNALAARDVRNEIKKLEKQGATGFVLDLRDDPGGLLDQAVDVTSLFIPSGVVVKVEQRGKPPSASMATGDPITNAPLAVLVNENSASASEIAAGALQDYGRAKLVGVKTFGKGSVQTVEELPFGGAIKFTTAHYLTPKGRAINGKGLEPDVVVKMAAEKQASDKTDTQLQRALAIVRQELGQ